MPSAVHHHPAAELCSRLVRRIADRDRDAFRQLHQCFAPAVARRVRKGLGDPSDVGFVTDAVFVEVWRLAPISAAHHHDAFGWLVAIGRRRAAERMGRATPEAVGYDEHTTQELAAILADAPTPVSDHEDTRPDRHRRGALRRQRTLSPGAVARNV
jgi:DNA-directed RNA polymerase specialized sigma24 family protein